MSPRTNEQAKSQVVNCLTMPVTAIAFQLNINHFLLETIGVPIFLEFQNEYNQYGLELLLGVSALNYCSPEAVR